MSQQSVEWVVSRWFNTDVALSLASLRGRVAVIGAFQMLCPGCVSHSIPQLARLDRLFNREDLCVIGLHSVFEHHHAMRPDALGVFIHEYGIAFPVAVDRHEGDDPLPVTMRSFALRGTPSTIVIDRVGSVRLNHFGHIDDLALGVLVGRLLSDTASSPTLVSQRNARAPAGSCEPRGCAV